MTASRSSNESRTAIFLPGAPVPSGQYSPDAMPEAVAGGSCLSGQSGHERVAAPQGGNPAASGVGDVTGDAGEKRNASSPAGRPPRRMVGPDVGKRIIAAVAASRGLMVADIIGDSRRSRISFARHIAMWLVRRDTKLSLSQIGRLFGGRDDSTVLYGLRRIDEMIARGEVVP